MKTPTITLTCLTVLWLLPGTVSAQPTLGGDAAAAAQGADELPPLADDGAAAEVAPVEEPREEPGPAPADALSASAPASVPSAVGASVATEPPPAPAPAAEEDEEDEEELEVVDRLLHGFRLGYMHILNSDLPFDPDSDDTQTFAERYGMRSPHHFLIGYEVTWRMIGHGWLNVLLTGNVLVSGLEQSRFFPSLNGILGFEIDESFQVGVGVSCTPTRDKTAHMLLAAGWTPRVGAFYVPVHFFFVPDVDYHHKLGVTVGVSF